MSRIRTLLLGNKEEDCRTLEGKYGTHPSEFIALPNGVNLHVRDEGNPESPAIVFLHGHTEDLHTWNNMAKKLVENFRVIRFDLRRHGLTGPAQDNEYNLESYVSDLSLFIQHFELDNFVLIGHSMGGRISTKYTIENPEKVNGLVLLSASGVPREEKTSPPMALRMMKNPHLVVPLSDAFGHGRWQKTL